MVKIEGDRVDVVGVDWIVGVNEHDISKIPNARASRLRNFKYSCETVTFCTFFAKSQNFATVIDCSSFTAEVGGRES